MVPHCVILWLLTVLSQPAVPQEKTPVPAAPQTLVRIFEFKLGRAPSPASADVPGEFNCIRMFETGAFQWERRHFGGGAEAFEGTLSSEQLQRLRGLIDSPESRSTHGNAAMSQKMSASENARSLSLFIRRPEHVQEVTFDAAGMKNAPMWFKTMATFVTEVESMKLQPLGQDYAPVCNGPY